ncbi:hypothetical protein D3C87_63890 [compost metagenome]
MRLLSLIIGIVLGFPALVSAQEVKLKEESVQFSAGSQQAIVAEIPYADREQVAKQLKSELKGWGGKLSIAGDEYKVTQGKMKAFGDKRFDGYAKIIQTGDDIKVAFAVDLGGTFMTSGAHPAEHRTISQRAQNFGSKTANVGIKAHVAADKKALKTLEKQEKEIEKNIESSTKNIENYQKKIKEEQKNIETKKAELSTKQEEIKNQNLQLTDRKKKAKNLK